jgi:O-antigen ligase
MTGINKTNKFLAFWITIPTFFSYSSFFFPKALTAFLIAPAGMFTISMFFYISFVFLRRPKIQSIPEIRYLIMLLVVLCIGLFYTNAPNYGFKKIFVLYTWIILFFLYAPIIVNSYEIYAKASVFCGAVFLILLYSRCGDPISFFKAMQVQGDVVRLGFEQESGSYGSLNPIWIARYLGFLFLMALFIVKKESRNFFLYGYMLVLFLYMVTAGSKGPIIALLGGCLIFFTNENVSVNIKTIFFLILIFTVFILLLNAIDFFSSSFFIERYSGKNTSVDDREMLINVAFQFSGIVSFLVGTGTGNFGYVISHKDERRYPHNIVAELYFENGIISLVILALIYISVLKYHRLIFKSRKLRMLFAIFVYFGLNSMFSGDLLGNEYFFIFFILFHFEKLMIQKTEQLEMQLEQFDPGTAVYLK